MRWRAFYSLDRDEHDPIADAAADFPAADNYLVVRMDVPGGEIVGDSQLSFDLSAENNETLVADEAERIFAELRDRAGLNPVGKRLLAFTPVVRPPWERALEKALKRDMDGLHEEAVVFAHVACETCGTAALWSLLVEAGVDAKVAERFIPSTTFRDRRHRGLLEALTGVRLQDQEWWPDYGRHIDRRNVVLHKGGDVTRDQSNESLNVARTFCDFIGRLAGRH